MKSCILKIYKKYVLTL